LGWGWYTLVQMVWLTWSWGHPYSYIYILYVLASLFLGLQFGILALFVTEKRIRQFSGILMLSALWTLIEYSRLYLFSGHPWHPIGLALSANLYSRQFAALLGTYGLTFWVMLTNLFFARALQTRIWSPRGLAFAVVAATPYLFGWAVVSHHHALVDDSETLRVALVQTVFPIEETLPFEARGDYLAYILEEWRTILTLTQPLGDDQVDLIVLPELVVPAGTYYLIFDLKEVKQLFVEVFGPEAAMKMAPLEQHLASREASGQVLVNNAYMLQSLANVTGSDVIAGLEDYEWGSGGEHLAYTAAYLFSKEGELPKRYEKRILVPMGEYIPFSFLRTLAASYGISGSFTAGESAKVFDIDKASVGFSICYEELFGGLMKENKDEGATLLVNLTSDIWYEGYGLPRVHLEHARLRPVEMGLPLIRSCNTGVTCVIDSLGRDVARHGETPQEEEKEPGLLVANVPLHTYSTPYLFWGDRGILLLSILFLVPLLRRPGKG